MALTSMDKGNPPEYFGGRDALAEALGHKLPAKDDTSAAAERTRAGAYASTKRVIRLLHGVGAIETIESGTFRRNAVYALRLRPVDNSSQGATESTPAQTTESTPKGVSQSTPKGATQSTVGVDSVADRGQLSRPPMSRGTKEEQLIGIKGGTKSPPAVDSPEPVDNSPVEDRTASNRRATGTERAIAGLQIAAQYAEEERSRFIDHPQ
jgi:hypothetical protein